MASRSRSRRRRIVAVAVLILVLAAAGVSWAVYSRRANGSSAQQVAPEDLAVKLGAASIADVQVSVEEIGTIEPVIKVDVKSTLSGKVTEVLIREGDRAAQGQVLARVEPDVNQAQILSEVKSELARAVLEVENARKNLEDQENLFREGYTSEQTLRDMRVAHERAQESHKNALEKFQIVEDSGIPLQAALTPTQRVNVVSPMNGVVTTRNAEVGDTIVSGVSSFNAGTVMFTVADLGSMLIKASVNEVDIGKVRDGMPVKITVDAFPYQHYDGRVSHISPSAKPRDKIKVFDVEVTLSRQHDEFRTGMTANVSIRGDRKEKVLTVPSEAIFKREDREVVFALKDRFDPPKVPGAKPRRDRDGKVDVSAEWERFFESRPVRIGLVSLERSEVLEGLKDGQRIALDDPTRVPVREED